MSLETIIAGLQRRVALLEASNTQLPVMTSDPSDLVAGMLWIRSDTGQMKIYDGVTTIVVGEGVPAGIIAKWEGSVGSIPSGWALCDGTNGTPNLVDKFVRGAGSVAAVGDEGGSTAHDHGVPLGGSHSHGGSTGLPTGGSGAGAGPGTAGPGHSHNITPMADHDHGGNTATRSTLPPWYALSYIMKL